MVLIEIKSVEEFFKFHYKQIVTYLKPSNISLVILRNLNTDKSS
ncbi:MAG: hypothetical protein KGZ74_14420 [Chitinophagaceae bacterium]|nr:hypothetical protein [Chitinophagaceae bacterium]